MRLFTPLYDKCMSWARHRHAWGYLTGLSFAESSFFPVPPDVMLAPMSMAQPGRAMRFAALTTLASVIGGLFGYLIGHYAFDLIEPWLQRSGHLDDYLHVRGWFDRWGFWAILVAGFSPIPYKVFTIAAGVAVLNFPAFVVASVIGRGARFFLVAGVVKYAGVRLEATLLRYIERIGWGMVVLTVVVIAYLMARG